MSGVCLSSQTCIAAALSACPKLESLHVDMKSFVTGASTSFDIVRSRASAIESLTVSGVSGAIESDTLAMFNEPNRLMMTLDYGGTVPIHRGFEILQDLHDSVHLTVSYPSGTTCLFACTDSMMRTREMRYDSPPALDGVWTHLPPSSIASFTVSTLPLRWRHFATGLPLLSNARTVRVVGFHTNASSDGGFALMAHTPQPPTQPFPGLSTMCLASDKEAIAGVTTSADTVVSLIRMLKGQGTISVLCLEGVRLEGDRSALGNVAVEEPVG